MSNIKVKYSDFLDELSTIFVDCQAVSIHDIASFEMGLKTLMYDAEIRY